MDESKRLRALLDERGIEHVDADDGHTQHTWWSDGDHEIGACNSGKRLAVYNLTPEQAIAATVGTDYTITFAPSFERPPVTMVGETVYDAEGNAIGWIVNASTEPDEATMLKLHDRMDAALLDYVSAMGIEGGNGAKTVPFVIEMHQIIEDAAKLGVGTCQIEERHGNWYCTGCGEMVGTCDTTSELCIDGNAIELWRHCPNCGRRIIEEVTE